MKTYVLSKSYFKKWSEFRDGLAPYIIVDNFIITHGDCGKVYYREGLVSVKDFIKEISKELKLKSYCLLACGLSFTGMIRINGTVITNYSSNKEIMFLIKDNILYIK